MKLILRKLSYYYSICIFKYYSIFRKCPEEDIEKNKQLLLDKLKMIIDQITSPANIDKMPAEMRYIFKFVIQFNECINLFLESLQVILQN